MNLTHFLSKTDIVKAVRVLSRSEKLFRKNFHPLHRYLSNTELNAFGNFFKKFDIDSFYESLKDHELTPYNGVAIKKKNGKLRPLLVPSPADRVIFTATFKKIKNVLEAQLVKRNALGIGVSEDKKQIEKTLSEIKREVSNGKYYVLCLDFKDYFSTIDRKKILISLSSKFKTDSEKHLYQFLKKSIHNKINMTIEFSNNFSHLSLDKIGIPQGLAYSPLLASYYGLRLDDVVSRCNKKYSTVGFRYLDDMIVLSKKKSDLMIVYREILKESKKMKLLLHPLKPGSKTKVVNANKETFDFLGINIDSKSSYVPIKAIEKFKETIQLEILNETTINYDEDIVKERFLNYAVGWRNYYKTHALEDYVSNVRPELGIWLEHYMTKYRKSNKRRFYQSNKAFFESW